MNQNTLFSPKQNQTQTIYGQPSVPSADMLAEGGISNELDTLRSELSSLRQWKQEATRFIESLFSASQQPVADNPAPQALQTQEPQAPHEALSQIQAQMEIEHLLNDFRGNNNDLQPFETSILLEAQHIALSAARMGLHVSDKQAIEQAVQVFRERLSRFGNPAITNPSQGLALQHMALKLDTGAAATDPKKLSADDIFHMPPEQFDQLRNTLRKQQYRLA